MNLATVINRRGKVTASIFEIKAILEDIKIHSLGAIKCGMEIFELAVVPMLLSNADTWTCLDEETIHELDKLQVLFLSVLLGVSVKGTPRPALFWDTGSISLENKIKMKKLNLIFHIKSLDDSCIAKEILNEQIKHGWPGLAQECGDLCEELNIPDIRSETNHSKSSWNHMVKKAVKQKNNSDLKTKICS